MDINFILDCLEKDIITRNEAVKLLESKMDAKAKAVVTEKTFDDIVDGVADEAINTIDIDSIIDIVQKMKWKYYDIGHKTACDITRDSLLENIRHIIKDAITGFFESNIKAGSDNFEVSTGGFRCSCEKEENTEYVIIELQFIPVEEYFDINYNETLNLYKKKYNI